GVGPLSGKGPRVIVSADVSILPQFVCEGATGAAFKGTHVRLWNIRSVTLVELSSPAICSIGPGSICVYYELSPMSLVSILYIINDGGALILKGANGSGKSTFIRMLAGLSKPSAGEILWNGHDITESGVFHQYKPQLNWLSVKEAIKSNFTVLDNV
ncbi:ABC transporter I family member 1, partial [Tanacetum coccineum]